MEMAGAAGAVSSLLGSLSSVLVDEVKQLWGVRRELLSIKDEMESMNSFLLDLEEVRRPSHQQRTWIRQVRDLAYSAERCIGLHQVLILREGHRSNGFLGYLPPVHMLHARHKLAMEIRELKERIEKVNARRKRYSVQIPQKSSDKLTTTTTTLAPITGVASSSQAAGGGDEGIMPSDDEQTPKDEEDDHNEPATPTDDPDRRALAFSETCILEDCTEKLVKWLKEDAFQSKLPSIAIAAQDIEDARDIAREALATDFVSKVINIKLPSFQRRPQDPLNILICILQTLLSQDQREDAQWLRLWRDAEEYYKNRIIAKIKEIEDNIKKHLEGKIAEIEETQGNIKKHLEGKRSMTSAVPLEPLGKLLLQLLPPPKPEPRQDKSVKEAMGKAQEEGKTIEEIATMLKEHMEKGEAPTIALDHTQYVHILREVFPPKPTEQEDTNTDQIEQKLEKIKQEILQEMRPKPQEDKSAEEATDIKVIEQTITEKIREIRWRIRMQLLIKVFVDKIKRYWSLNRTLIILQHLNFASGWKEIRHALSLLHCADGNAVIVTTNSTEEAKEFCYPEREPIICSLVSVYHDKVLQLTNRQMKDDEHAKIFRDILVKCEPHEFCMQIFARALYANPNRSLHELQKLQRTLVRQGPLGRNAKRMFKFSYNDLPREYKVCLLYLAIFPPGHNIKRSTLIGRWVAEGLITKEEWPGSVRQAEQCFDELIDRCLVYPGDIGAAGKVKSCMVHDLVHEFISKIAKKKHFVDTRLSHHLARHFSVGSDVRLRSSDNIEKFLQKLYRIPQLPLVKVLDLEGCRYFEKNQHYLKNIFKKSQHYLKNICNKMLLLKYLSLRNTDITKLPKEINNLRLLEVLDIRHTHVMTASATKYLVLLKLKRLLAGCIHPTKSLSAPQIPDGIGEMTNMEVLSHVEASQRGSELKDIGKLWQLRKLGVVIHDKKAHLENLVRVIGDLSESLRSLSISIKPLQASSHGTPSNTDISFENPPKLLERLSISGFTSGHYTHLVKHCDGLAKVTLHNTHLNQENMKDLGKLAMLRCVRLRHESYTERNLTFKKEEFQNLKYLLVEGSNMTDISFEDGAAPELEKIVLSLADMKNISFGNGAATQLEKIVLSSINITSITFANEAATKLNEIALSCTNITSIIFENGATPNLKKIIFRDIEAPKLEEIVLSSTITGITFKNGAAPRLKEIVLYFTNITSITFENGATPNLKKIILSFTKIISITFENGATPNLKKIIFGDTAAPQPEKTLSSTITGITFKNGAAPRLEEIVLSFTKRSKITSITFENGATPNLKKIVLSSININSITFGNGAAPKLEEIALSSTNITSITFPNGTTPNLKKIALSFTNMEFLSGINMLGLKELELNGTGITSASLLSLFTNGNQIAKVTLRDTLLKQGELQILAKQPNLSSLMLLDKSCDESHLTFSKEEFQNLNLLVVECFGITKISFAEGAAPKLKKIVWSFTDIQSLSGIDNLPALKELEFKGDKIPNQVREAIAAHQNRLVPKDTQQKNAARFLSILDEEDKEQRIPRLVCVWFFILLVCLLFMRVRLIIQS